MKYLNNIYGIGSVNPAKIKMASKVLPFSNEIASVLTASGIAIFSGLYQHSPEKLLPTVSKTLIDFAALSGIVMSSVQTAEEGGSLSGIVHGVLVIFVAFVVPNLTFHAITHKYCGKCSPVKKLVFGLGLIGLLFLVEKLVVHNIAHSFAEKHHE